MLSAGTHVVTATVIDSGGLTASRQISITVISGQYGAGRDDHRSPTTTVFPAGASIAFAGIRYRQSGRQPRVTAGLDVEHRWSPRHRRIVHQATLRRHAHRHGGGDR